MCRDSSEPLGHYWISRSWHSFVHRLVQTMKGNILFRSEMSHRLIILGPLGLFGGILGSLHLVYSDFVHRRSHGLR